MRVFVTGAAAFSGSAPPLFPSSIGAGHSVTGLARSGRLGRCPHRGRGPGTSRRSGRSRRPARGGRGGRWRDPPRVQRRHGAPGDFQGAVDADRRAVAALGEALTGSTGRWSSPPRPVASTGAGGNRTGRASVLTRLACLQGGRLHAALGGEVALSFASLRRPFVERLCDLVRRVTATGITDSSRPWSVSPVTRESRASPATAPAAGTAVHRLDVAHLFRLALEKAPAGSRLHAVADEGVPIRAIAEVIGRHLDVPVVSVPAGEASGALRLPGLASSRPTTSGLERADPRAAGLAAGTSRAHRGPR